MLNIQKRLKDIEKQILFNIGDIEDFIVIIRETTDADKKIFKYTVNYKNEELSYDDYNDFFNEYDIDPNKTRNPILYINVVDNTHLEKVFWETQNV